MKIGVSFCLLLALCIISCSKGKKNDDSCNGESTRRDIKICSDSDSKLIDLTPIKTSVKDFGTMNVSEVGKSDERQAVEFNVYTITAEVHKISYHRDGDWKIKLTNGNDQFVNCENPNPGCEFVANSLFKDNHTLVRNWIIANEDDIVGKTVTITGVGFIDIDHKYPRNAAENEMEIHPILEISF